MRCLVMFITTVCLIFLLKLKWPKNKSVYDVTPFEYIYIDKRCRGDKDSPSKGESHFIAYGIEGKQSDVNSDVNDPLYLLENGKNHLYDDCGGERSC